MAKDSGKQMEQHKRSQHLRFMRQRTDAQGKETLRSSLCYATANHSDLPKKVGFSKRQWENEIPVSLLPSMFFLLYTKRGKCAAQVWTDRTELEAVGQLPGH